MAFGAIVGAIFGIGSSILASNEEDKAQRYARAAADIRLKQQDMSNAITRRNSIRGYRAQAAQAVAAGASEGNTSSSFVTGSESSLGSQAMSNIDYFDKQKQLDDIWNQLNKKSGHYIQTANTWNAVGQQSGNIGMALNGIYNLATTPTQSSSSPNTTTTPNG